jgi:hypothetical protein
MLTNHDGIRTAPRFIPTGHGKCLSNLVSVLGRFISILRLTVIGINMPIMNQQRELLWKALFVYLSCS